MQYQQERLDLSGTIWIKVRVVGSQKGFTLVEPGELLVYDGDHVGGGGAPAGLPVGLLRTAPGEPGGTPGRHYLRPRLRTVPGHGGPVEEGGQGP